MTQQAPSFDSLGIVKLMVTVEPSPPVTPRVKTEDGFKVYSPKKGHYLPPPPLHGLTVERPGEDIQETTGKTNHLASLCFGTAVFFMGLAFYDIYYSLSERSVSLLLRGIFWATVASVIGTAGEMLQTTTRVETPIVPIAIYQTPAVYKEGQFPGMPNVGNTCFINAPTQAIMADDLYPQVYKTICERAKARHISFESFLELYPAQSGVLSAFVWPKMFSWKREIEPPLAVVNTKDVVVMLMRRKSSINYDSPEFLTKYPNIHNLIGVFSTITKEADFPEVPDNNVELRQEFGLMRGDAALVKFFDQERTKIANEILGFNAFLNLIHAYEAAVEQKLPVVSFGTWISAPIGNIRHLISGAGGVSEEDVDEFLHCLSKYVMPDDYPEVFFSLTYERVWEECPEQDREKIQELLEKHQNPRGAHDVLTQIPDDKKICERSAPMGILHIKSLLREGVDGQTVLDETFKEKKAPTGPNEKVTHFYLGSDGLVKNYYLVSEKIVAPKVMPERIILELLRYNVDGEHGRRGERIDCAVYMPQEMTICGLNYGLNSIVCHTGTSENGHYLTFAKKQGQWWYASDNSVDTAEEAHVGIAARDGYLYFYARHPD